MTYVIATGVLYGEGENMWHSFFKSAWHGEQPGLKVFGDGQNVVPTIHVKDLARLVKERLSTDEKDIYTLTFYVVAFCLLVCQCSVSAQPTFTLQYVGKHHRQPSEGALFGGSGCSAQHLGGDCEGHQ